MNPVEAALLNASPIYASNRADGAFIPLQPSALRPSRPELLGLAMFESVA